MIFSNCPNGCSHAALIAYIKYTTFPPIVIVIARLLSNELLHSLKWLLAKFAPLVASHLCYTSTGNDATAKWMIYSECWMLSLSQTCLLLCRLGMCLCVRVFQCVSVAKTFYMCLASNRNFTLHSDKSTMCSKQICIFIECQAPANIITSHQSSTPLRNNNVKCPSIQSDNFKCIHTNKLFIANTHI